MKFDKLARSRVALYTIVIAAFLGFAGWTIHIVVTVGALRADVERMVGSLSTLSRIQARMQSPDEQALAASLGDLDAVATSLAVERASDAELDAAIVAVGVALRAERPGAAAGSRAAIENLVALIRKRTAELSRQLGAQWDSLYAVVAAALLLATVVSALVIHTVSARVARLEHERELAYERLRHANRLSAVGTLAAAAAHEIGNPLTFTLLNLEHLTAELGSSPELQEIARDALTGVQRVSAITSDLKSFARPDEGPTGGVSVHAAIEGALRLFEPARKADVKVVKRLDPVPTVHASQRRLEQVFLNLLLNANHAIDEDKGGTIVLETTREADKAVARVIDDGCGISPDVERRLFEAFATTKPSGKGTGLGLFVSRSIIEAARGSLELSANPSGGTVAEVSLPADKRGAGAE